MYPASTHLLRYLGLSLKLPTTSMDAHKDITEFANAKEIVSTWSVSLTWN